MGLSYKLLALQVIWLFLWTLSELPADIAKIELPSIFADNMVLQRDRANLIWGKATPRETVKVTLAGRTTIITASADGSWSANLPELPAGGPYELTVTGIKRAILHNVLVGDVWLCAGQSNMGIVLKMAAHSKDDIFQANCPALRYFHVSPVNASEPCKDVKGKWQIANRSTVPTFSAIAYYFARDIERKTKIPVGIIECSLTTTSIRGWISKASLGEPVKKFPNCSSSSVFNGMIAPLSRFGIKGIVWYQGESDVLENSFKMYGKRLAALINDWRGQWHDNKLPFFCIQIPNFYQTRTVPTDSAWAELREGQLTACSEVADAHIVVTIDTAKGPIAGIHPKEKEK